MYEHLIIEMMVIVTSFIVVLTALKMWYNIKLTNKNWSKVANLSRRVSEIEADMSENVGKAASVSDLGDVDALLDQFGIDSSILKNPMISKLIKQYAPKILEGVKNKNEEKTKNFL